MKDTNKACRSANHLCIEGGQIETQILKSDLQGPEQMTFYLYNLINYG